MKIGLTILICFVQAILLFAQDKQPMIEQFQSQINQAPRPHQKIDLMNKFSYELFGKNSQKSLELANEALKLAEKVDYPKGKSESLLNHSRNYWDLGDYPKALDFAYNSLKISEKHKFKIEMAIAYNMIGIINNAQGNVQLAVKYYGDALKIFEDLKEEEWQAKVLNNIGEIYKKKKQASEALDYYFRSLKINEHINSDAGRAVCLNNIGEIYFNQKNYAQALEYLVKSLKIKEKISNKRSLAITLNNLARTYENIGEADSALTHAQRALLIAKDGGLLSDMVEANKILSNLFASKKNYDEAYHYFQEYSRLRDSLFSHENSEKISELQTRYETEKREQKITILKAQQERNQLIMGLFAVALLVAIGGIATFYQLSRYRKRKNREIMVRNRTINQAREEIRKANEELKSANTNLEEKVKERTLMLRQVNEELTLTNRELDIFIYRASHDFKAPFASLMGLINLGRMQIQDANAPDLFQEMEFTVAKADTMLNKMLMMNIINHKSKKHIGSVEVIDFQLVINNIIENIPERIIQDCTFDYQIHISPDLYFASDIELINIILQNLIENAVFYAHYRPDKRATIKIEALTTKDGLQLTIWDNGIGVSEDEYENIFKMFYRGTEYSKGNGLGLYVVKKALDKLKGKIQVESKINEFTCFTITIPPSKTPSQQLFSAKAK
jgi:signal transduction histidine kinase